MQSKKYRCSKTKDEILNIIVSEFKKVNADYDNSLQNNNRMLQDRNHGRCVAMFDLLDRLGIKEV